MAQSVFGLFTKVEFYKEFGFIASYFKWIFIIA